MVVVGFTDQRVAWLEFEKTGLCVCACVRVCVCASVCVCVCAVPRDAHQGEPVIRVQVRQHALEAANLLEDRLAQARLWIKGVRGEVADEQQSRLMEARIELVDKVDQRPQRIACAHVRGERDRVVVQRRVDNLRGEEHVGESVRASNCAAGAPHAPAPATTVPRPAPERRAPEAHQSPAAGW